MNFNNYFSTNPFDELSLQQPYTLADPRTRTSQRVRLLSSKRELLKVPFVRSRRRMKKLSHADKLELFKELPAPTVTGTLLNIRIGVQLGLGDRKIIIPLAKEHRPGAHAGILGYLFGGNAPTDDIVPAVTFGK